ncbi:hypothetical protein AVEN_140636-1 [Araneus ventricosus]|uniref:Uncharacterized protein n=1 Tax=Araneus ventricosus TaxID=182803 RepID=A0A4Y2GHX5_ARAVE|nr:hypothetical protein AVEN_140636-1 [Araneus ventricosus]
MVWSGEHRVLMMDAYLKNDDCVITSQPLFRRHFGLDGNAKFLIRKPFCASQNSEKAVLRSPQRSACRHATAMEFSDQSVRRILLLDLKFHPYKMMVMQEIKDRDWANSRESSEAK